MYICMFAKPVTGEPVTGEHLTAGAVIGEARLDVNARNFWSPLAKTSVDIKLFHPKAHLNAECKCTCNCTCNEHQP